jgi:N-(2-amino-2-carboxyethyl)-L-glutamate synthase
MLLKKMLELRNLICDTKVVKLSSNNEVDVYVKVEFNLVSRSIKDRAAFNILYEGISKNHIHSETTLVESSSGNLAVSLAIMASFLGLKFIPVIDANICKVNELKLRFLCDQVEKIEKLSEGGGYLLGRLERVKDLCRNGGNVYWTNQYENLANANAYSSMLAPEIISKFPTLDYLFVAVSSGGTIAGLSSCLKAHYKNIHVVAVDIEGSNIFARSNRERYLSGLGASIRSRQFDFASIDSVEIVTHKEIVDGCHSLLKEHGIMAGASTGANYGIVKKYMESSRIPSGAQVLFIAHDTGDAYIDTVYDRLWCNALVS